MVALFILVFSLSRKVNFHLFFGEIWQEANPCVSLANMWAFSDDALGRSFMYSNREKGSALSTN